MSETQPTQQIKPEKKKNDAPIVDGRCYHVLTDMSERIVPIGRVGTMADLLTIENENVRAVRVIDEAEAKRIRARLGTEIQQTSTENGHAQKYWGVWLHGEKTGTWFATPDAGIFWTPLKTIADAQANLIQAESDVKAIAKEFT